MTISDIQAQMMLSNGSMGFLTSTVDERKDEKLCPTKVPVMQDFVKVFLEELPELPPERKISFEIELLSRTGPISKVPYEWLL